MIHADVGECVARRPLSGAPLKYKCAVLLYKYIRWASKDWIKVLKPAGPASATQTPQSQGFNSTRVGLARVLFANSQGAKVRERNSNGHFIWNLAKGQGSEKAQRGWEGAKT